MESTPATPVFGAPVSLMGSELPCYGGSGPSFCHSSMGLFPGKPFAPILTVRVLPMNNTVIIHNTRRYEHPSPAVLVRLDQPDARCLPPKVRMSSRGDISITAAYFCQLGGLLPAVRAAYYFFTYCRCPIRSFRLRCPYSRGPRPRGCHRQCRLRGLPLATT